MKWLRVAFAGILVTMAFACSNPTLPRYPDPEDPEPTPGDSLPKSGFLVPAGGPVVFLA